jgi:hypothetical protein
MGLNLSLLSARICTSIADSLAAHPKSQYLMRVSIEASSQELALDHQLFTI